MLAMFVMRESLQVTIALTIFAAGFAWGYFLGYGNGRLDEMTKK